MTADPIDKFANAVANDQLRRAFIELLDEEPFSRFGDWSQSLLEIAAAVDEARELIDQWAEEEDRAEKAELKEQALTALESLVNVWNESPLDCSQLADWEIDEIESGDS